DDHLRRQRRHRRWICIAQVAAAELALDHDLVVEGEHVERRRAALHVACRAVDVGRDRLGRRLVAAAPAVRLQHGQHQRRVAGRGIIGERALEHDHDLRLAVARLRAAGRLPFHGSRGRRRNSQSGANEHESDQLLHLSKPPKRVGAQEIPISVPTCAPPRLALAYRGPCCQTPTKLPLGSRISATHRSPSGYGASTTSAPSATAFSRVSSRFSTNTYGLTPPSPATSWSSRRWPMTWPVPSSNAGSSRSRRTVQPK